MCGWFLIDYNAIDDDGDDYIAFFFFKQQFKWKKCVDVSFIESLIKCVLMDIDI